MKTLSQRRAETALGKVREVSLDREYRSKIEETPGLIAVNGLLATLLHLQDKQHMIARHIAEWLAGPNSPVPWTTPPSDSLAKHLASETGVVYQAATLEALEYTTWLKKWAQALIAKPQASQASQTGAPQEVANGAVPGKG